MDEAHAPELLLLGRVVKPHGLDGTLSIRSYAESKDSFVEAGRVVLLLPGGEQRGVSVVSARPHKKGMLLNLEGIDSLEAAEGFRDAEIFIRADALESDREDEYYWFELIGLEVYGHTGRYVGTLEQILPTGGSDVYVVRSKQGEVLIPASREVIEEIDLDNRSMTVFEMEGLLDLNEV